MTTVIEQLSRTITDYNVSGTPTIKDTNCSDLVTVHERIEKLSTFATTAKLKIVDVNCNYLALVDKSQGFCVNGLKLKYESQVKDKELLLNKTLLNIDRTGIAIIKAIHQVLMPVLCYNDKTFLKYLLDVYITELKILKFFNDNTGDIRSDFTSKYFNGLKKGDKFPGQVFTKIILGNRKFTDTNIEKRFFDRKVKRPGKKGNSKEKRKNNITSKKTDVGDISNSTFKAAKKG